MKLRKIKIIDPILVSKSQARPRKQSRLKRNLEAILILLLLIAGYRHFSLLKAEAALVFTAVYDYIKFCIANVLSRPGWQVFLLFAPALVFDTLRYFLTNTIVFFTDIFRGKPREDLDKSAPHSLVSVILPAYNEQKRIRKTLDSILENDYPNFEVIVVDDGSTDSTPAICKDYERKSLIKYLRKAERAGKPSALNYGLKFAKGEYIIHCDAEVVVYRNTIREGLRPFKDPRVGIVSGNVKVYNDRKSLAARLQAAEYGMCIAVQRRWLALTDSLQIASGAFSLFRREVLEKTMGSDPETGDDLDITLKVKKLGFKVAFAPRAVALTNVPDTFYKLFRQRIRWDECYIRLNLRKHGNIANLRRFKFGDFFAFISDIIFNLILLLVFPVYIVLIAIFVPELFLFILVATYIFYTLMNLWQFVIVTILSEDPSRDAVFILYVPLFFIYSLFLRGVRIIAYTLESFRLKYLRDSFFPQKIWENIPRY